MPTVNEEYSIRSVHSIRVNDRLVEIAKQTGLPLSTVVESTLVNFASLNDEEKIKFLVKNNPDKVCSTKLREPGFNFANEAVVKAKENLGNKRSDRTSSKVLIAMGLALLAAFFLGKQEES